MNTSLATCIFWIGAAQWSVLAASVLVPLQLDWQRSLAPLPRLLRQMVWVYGGYVVLSIVFLGLVCLTCADELASGSPLARIVCGYAAVFWGVRLCLQGVFHAQPFLKTRWLRAGYRLLSAMFAAFTLVLGWAALG